MKIISSAFDLEKEFMRLLRQYNVFYWATAWAGVDSLVYRELCSQEAKIKQVVVGIHFYQTDPDFIKRFLNNKNVKFVKQPEGTFHPKLYLFYDNDSKWEMLVGSANFTKSAFSRNTEATFLIDSKNDNENALLKQSFAFFEKCWKEGDYFDIGELEKYIIVWNIQKRKITSLSGKFGNRSAKPLHELPFITLSWKQFVEKIKAGHDNTLKNRLRALEIARTLFECEEHFSNLAEGERGFIAGIYNDYDIPGAENWGCFGSMVGAGMFKNKIKTNNYNISKALDEIPLYGEVTEDHFNKYKDFFSKVFPGNSIATFSRLLTMKRPDIFYCITSANKKNFCAGYDIIYSRITYDTYWNEIVLKIINSNWWLNPSPNTFQESKISNSRAAFLDAFCYEKQE
jgi:hypothetical protein